MNLLHLSRFQLAVLLLWVTVPAVGESPPVADALTEFSAGEWSAVATGGFSAAVFDDATRVQAGSRSLRLDTDAPFDCYFWAPSARNANWDFSGASRIQFWIYAVNDNPPGFQNNGPQVKLGSNGGTIVYAPSSELLNSARNNWLFIDIPLIGNSTWTRTDSGAVTLADVDYIEIHADTWDAGFQLWVDDLTIQDTPPNPDGLSGVALNGEVELTWLPYAPTPNFSHFAVYRSGAAFSSVLGMTPIATIPNAAATTYADNSAVNGASYFYAVTAVTTTDAEDDQVDSIGPLTPRDDTDLQVTYIERTPKYPRYAPTYTNYTITEPGGFGPYNFSAATGLGNGQTGATQRFPNNGDIVTYTANVRNRGTNVIAGPIGVAWRYDGIPIGTDSIPGPLTPGDVATASITRAWDGLEHDLSFSMEISDDRAGNNVLTIDTNAVGLLSFVDENYLEEFREDSVNFPGAVTDDFIDWLNYHMDTMNQMFEDAGTPKRVRYDRLDVLADSAPDPIVDTINYAIFPFRFHASEFGGALRTTGYYRANYDIDFGLLHEIGHQLGLIDIYRLNLPGNLNLASGRGYSATPCLMNGVSTFFSENSAGAMTLWQHVAHGYFGQYMYQMPQTITMRFLNSEGAPIEGANVQMYQKVDVPGQGEIIPNQIKAQGVTNANGEWVLPNVPIDSGMVPTTYAGDTLNPNPFGYLAVVGNNGLLHFRIEKNNAVDYAWLEVLDVNNAYRQGQTVNAVFDRSVAVGGPTQVIPPPELTELNAADWIAAADGSSPENTYVEDEMTPGLFQVGQSSLKFTTDGGFDTLVRYPGALAAQWDLSSVNTINVRFRTFNPSIGFQTGPIIRLGDNENNYYEYQYYSAGSPVAKLNETRGIWRGYAIPINAPMSPFNGWGRTTVGTPDLTNIQYVEIHADTWDAGFTMWVDGLSFDPPPCLQGDLNGDGQRNGIDVSLFSEALISGGTSFELCAGDFDGSGVLGISDVSDFFQCVLNGGTCP
ncbi:MAG: hypothetical protein H6818_02500 [Phycisphaerales bacterium]|nr:hypothetical protein [Phycisphaerales bacterium]MCB9863185.1 hypothetical protein [Phycisphaerales bacterium]